MHEHHEKLPGYHPEQLLHDGCPECETRGKDPNEAIVHLDADRFARAWARAAAWQRDQYTGPLALCEIPMLRALWTMQLMFERFGIAKLGELPPRGKTLADALAEENDRYPVRILQRNALVESSDLNKRITVLERGAILTACELALR